MSKSTGSTLVDTPTCVLAAARGLPGWALSYHKTERHPDGTLHVIVRLAHRGGFTVPHASFRARANGYRLLHIHSAVAGGTATVWLTLRLDR